MDLEQKLITIKPKEDKKSSKATVEENVNPKPPQLVIEESGKKKLGRPKLPPEMLKKQKKTNDSYTLTDARKAALKKATMTRAMNRELKKQNKIIIPAPDSAPAAEPQYNDVLQKIGNLESTISSINDHIQTLLKQGVYHDENDSQGKSNEPQEPLELRTPDSSKKEESFVRVSGSAKSMTKVKPDETNVAPRPAHIKHNYGLNKENFFFW